MAMISVLRADLMMGALKNWEVPEDLNCYGEMQYSEKASPFFMHRSLVLCCLNNTLMTLARQIFTFTGNQSDESKCVWAGLQGILFN